MLCLCLGWSVGYAQPEPLHGPPTEPGGRPGLAEERTEETTRKGFVFVEGEYLPPPYTIRLVEDRLEINGRALRHTLRDPAMFAYGGHWNPGGHGGPGGWGPPGRGRGGGPRIVDSAARQLSDVHSQLSSGGVVISFAGQPLVLLDTGSTYDLLCTMTGNLKPLRRVSLSEKLPPDFDTEVWTEWMTTFKPSPELTSRAVSLISAFDAADEEAAAAVRATRRLHALAYPLTVAGMILSVLSIGHLFGGRPHAGKPTHGVDASPEMIRTLNWSLVFIILLSALDVTWTILAAQANQMLELNPIGSHLINEPRHLVGFKFGIMLPVVGLLWLLRKHKRAQVAAWWACLILTILACRWLMLTSGQIAV